MSVTLSSADLERLARATRLLVAPLDHPDIDEWRSRVNHCLKELLNADTAGFHLPVEDGPLFYSDDYPPEVLDAFPDIEPPPLPDGTDIVQRGMELGVSKLELAYGRHVDRYHASPYYNEYSTQIGKYDLMFTMSPLSGPDPEAVASLQFFHDRRTGRRFGERELALLRLLFPAFRAGAESYVRWGRHRAELLGSLDTLGLAAMVAGHDGAILHRTPALGAALEADPERRTIESALLAAAAAVRSVAPAGANGSALPPGGLEREVRTERARYTVRGCLYGGGAAGAAPLVLVSLDRRTPAPPSAAEMREAFGFTPAEARVAVLLAARKSNAEIAEQLFISPHTARRHTERVLQKLQVRSRTEVAGKLAR